MSILDSQVGNNSSCIWRSIWESISFIKKGAYKCVGSGGSIFIWNDCWLSGKDDTKIYSLRANNGKLFLVSDLIVNYR